jgi:hypothetical protein
MRDVRELIPGHSSSSSSGTLFNLSLYATKESGMSLRAARSTNWRVKLRQWFSLSLQVNVNGSR